MRAHQTLDANITILINDLPYGLVGVCYTMARAVSDKYLLGMQSVGPDKLLCLLTLISNMQRAGMSINSHPSKVKIQIML